MDRNLNERIFSVLYDDNTYRIPTIGPENASPSHSYYSEDAIFFSGYIQDKLEYENFIMNVGIRYDLFDPQSSHIDSLLNPENFLPRYSIPPDGNLFTPGYLLLMLSSF